MTQSLHAVTLYFTNTLYTKYLYIVHIYRYITSMHTLYTYKAHMKEWMNEQMDIIVLIPYIVYIQSIYTEYTYRV